VEVPGVIYGIAFGRDKTVRGDVYLCGGDETENKRIYDYRLERRHKLEETFGEPLRWERLDRKVACRIAAVKPGSIDDNSSKLAESRQWIAGSLVRLRSVFKGPATGCDDSQ
jgi:hypothetical protein